MTDHDFFDVPQKSRTCKAGKVALPILYHDASCLMTLFTAPEAAVHAVMATDLVRPITLPAGKAVVAVVWFEYRGTSVGPYNEVAVAVPVVPQGTQAPLSSTLDVIRSTARGDLGFHIIDLPVTTAMANAAGREFWGFPKFVTEIGFQWHGVHFSGYVRDPGGQHDIVSLAGRSWPVVPLPAADFTLWSNHKKQLLRTALNVRHGMQWNLNTDMKISVGASEHPMAQRLRLLEVDGKKPFAVLSTYKLQSRLNAGEKYTTPEEVEAVDV